MYNSLVACEKKADPITLPQIDDITSVDITVGENKVNHTDKAWISEIISDISSSEPTSKESIQDTPQVKIISKLIFSSKQGQVSFMYMRTVVILY